MSMARLRLPVRFVYHSDGWTYEAEERSQSASPEMIATLRALRKKYVVGVVGGSDYVKVSEQLSVHGAVGMSIFQYICIVNYH